MNHPYTKLMHDIDARYQASSGLTDRRYYSIFYGPLAPFPIAVINENPGGTPENYQVVDVDAGQHEYVEGRFSGKTTLNGAELLRRLLGAPDFEPVRQFQIFNRLFRRSPNSGSFSGPQKKAFAAEARPFLLECLKIVKPRLLIFGGANAAVAFMNEPTGRYLPSFRSKKRQSIKESVRNCAGSGSPTQKRPPSAPNLKPRATIGPIGTNSINGPST